MRRGAFRGAIALLVLVMAAQVQADQGCQVCGDEQCGGGCVTGCCDPGFNVFGELLMIRARDAEIAYAVPMDGPVAPGRSPIQIGATDLLDVDYEAAFRLGFGFSLNDCSSVGLTWTRFESSTAHQDSIDPADGVIHSLVSHPSSVFAASDVLEARAQYDLDFDLIDLDYRRMLSVGPSHSFNYLVGIRYAHLDQAFDSEFVFNGTETVSTDIRFDGGGIRVGLEGERRSRCGLLVYGRGVASFMAGDFRASYVQGNSFDNTVVMSDWKAGRLVSILDLEVGVGWASPCNHWRATVGYLVSGWFNTVKTDDFIQSVQTNNWVGLDDSLGFDGLTARLEYRY